MSKAASGDISTTRDIIAHGLVYMSQKRAQLISSALFPFSVKWAPPRIHKTNYVFRQEPHAALLPPTSELT